LRQTPPADRRHDDLLRCRSTNCMGQSLWRHRERSTLQDCGTQTELGQWSQGTQTDSPAERCGWLAREDRAERAGFAAGEKVAGVRQYVETSPALGGGLDEKRVFVVLRARAGIAIRGIHRGGFGGISHLLRRPDSWRGELDAECVFHGFASLREARVYWRAAGRHEEPPLI
jgi:hypothetical protein